MNTCALLDAAIKAGVQHFIFSSTAAVYGNAEHGAGARGRADRADLALRHVEADVGDHAARRRRARTACASSCCATSTSPAPIRSCAPGSRRRGATHLIKVACEAALGKRAKHRRLRHRLSDAGRHLHPRLHPRQRSRARAFGGARAICARGGASATFNCGYGHGSSVLEVIDAVRRASGRDFPVEIAGAPRPAIRPRWWPTSRASARRSTGARNSTISTPSSRHALAWERRLPGKREIAVGVTARRARGANSAC